MKFELILSNKCHLRTKVLNRFAIRRRVLRDSVIKFHYSLKALILGNIFSSKVVKILCLIEAIITLLTTLGF